MRTKPDHPPSSGNVFRDLDLPAADEALLGVDKPKISALSRGRLSGFSTRD